MGPAYKMLRNIRIFINKSLWDKFEIGSSYNIVFVLHIFGGQLKVIVYMIYINNTALIIKITHYIFNIGRRWILLLKSRN